MDSENKKFVLIYIFLCDLCILVAKKFGKSLWGKYFH